jgi:hypothetical protein
MAENWAEAAGKKVKLARERNRKAVEFQQRESARITELAVVFWKSFQDIAEKAIQEFNRQLEKGSECAVFSKERDKIEVTFELEILSVALGGSAGRKNCLTVTRTSSPLEEGKPEQHSFELIPPDKLWLRANGKQLRPADAVKEFLEPMLIRDIEGEK